MAKFVEVDGKKFISAEALVEAMMNRIMFNTYYHNSLVVSESEAELFEAFEQLLVELDDKGTQEMLRHRYVMDRFWKRRHVE